MTISNDNNPISTFIPTSTPSTSTPIPTLIQNVDTELLDILKFYENDTNIKQFIETVVEKTTNIPLRIYNWLVTNYAKKYNIYYTILRPNGKKETFYVFENYQNQLNTNKKKGFDPYFRCSSNSHKLSYTNKETNETIYFETSIGQLKFFRWAIENLIVDYVNNNIKKIRDDLNENEVQNIPKKGKKTELSKSIHKTPIISFKKQTVSWIS